MADVVQYRLERMLGELEDLEQKGIFSRREIAEIVKKRRKFEYRLKRPCPLKQDFLSYIEYETRVDSLRNLRKKSFLKEADESDRKKLRKKSVSDFSCVKRILQIYRLAVTRFKGDIDIWFRYLEFCRERGHRKMKEVLAQVLRLHPKVPGLWIYAAAWEFDHNLNVVSARALMQSGLRACPKSEDLWIEYLRMELTYLNKLQARKAALGENVGTLIRDKVDNEEWKNENEDLFLSLEEKKGNTDESDANKEKDVDAFQEKCLMLYRTIYSGATDAIPSNFSLCKRFLEILGDIELDSLELLKNEIMDDIKRKFSGQESYWDWLARCHFFVEIKRKKISEETVHSQLNKAIQVYEEASITLPSTKMFSLYASFYLDAIDFVRKESKKSQSWNNLRGFEDELANNLLKVYENAKSKSCLTEELAHQYVSFYLQLGKLQDARMLIEKLCTGDFSEAAKLWTLRVSVEIKLVIKESTSVSKNEVQSVFDLLRQALTKFPLSKSESLWFMAMKFFLNKREYFEKLVQLLLIQLVKCRNIEDGYNLASAIVNFILQRDGMLLAREMYSRFLATPHPSLSFYKYCIDLESNLAYVGNDECLTHVRKLYESALSIYKQDKGLWKNFYSLEVKVGTSETANAVYWRARKKFPDVDELISSHNL